LRQAPKTFYDKLKQGLLERGWNQSQIDPCLFMKPGMICVVYVDDTIIGALDIADINREIDSLGIIDKTKKHVFTLRNEGAVSDFLGIRIQQIDKLKFKFTQLGLIEKLLRTMHLEECNGCPTPATTEPLHADLDGPVFQEAWKYDSVIGMMMYLANNTRPDIAYAVHQAARFTHHPRHSHAVGVKRIARYLKQTKLEGMLFCPQTSLRVDCYVDADFAGSFSVANKQDPVSVKSRTGYVIMYRGAPLLWASKMQTQIALSTMEAEYIALSQAMRDLIPIREVLKEIMTVVFEVNKSISYVTHSKSVHAPHNVDKKYNIPPSTVFEDNDACLKFAQMPRLTPRTKHIGIPYHWFREQVESLQVQLERIDTKNQLADQFTKGLSATSFQDARKRLVGW
jgi:Reverse transcriptase (RNA-dependent DNA polymerase)